VLDIGCGLGSFLKILNIPNKEKFGVESNDYAVQACQKDGLNVTKVENVYKLAFEDNYFDVVIMNEVIEHIEKPLLILKEIYRVLKNGGNLVITTPNKNLLVKNLDPSHLSEMSYSQLEKIVKKANLKIETHKVSGMSVYNFVGRRLIFPLGRLILRKTKIANKSIINVRDTIDHSNINKFRDNFISFGAQQLLIARKV